MSAASQSTPAGLSPVSNPDPDPGPGPATASIDALGVGDPGLTPPSVSIEARRIASAILDVLAGVRSITEAAQALGITTARYYAWESRAVTALVAACEPRNPGPVPGAALPAEIERLRAERDRLKAEAARYQALARIAQAAFGPPPSPPAPTAPGGGAADRPGARQRRARATPAPTPTAATGPRPRQRKRPTVRALRLAKQVRDAGEAGLLAPPATSAPPPAIPPASAAG